MEKNKKGCGIKFSFFGALYPHAVCLDGYLYDMDSWDGEGYSIGGDVPCPICNTRKFIELFGENDVFENKENVLKYIEKVKRKYIEQYEKDFNS